MLPIFILLILCNISPHRVSGPFIPTYGRSRSVDFSPIAMEYYSIVMPLQLKNDMGLIIRPFDPEVWIFSLISIPVFIATMGLANYIFLNMVRWDRVFGFALRIVFVEPAVMLYEKYAYQKILSIVWMASFFVLARSYSGESYSTKIELLCHDGKKHWFCCMILGCCFFS